MNILNKQNGDISDNKILEIGKWMTPKNIFIFLGVIFLFGYIMRILIAFKEDPFYDLSYYIDWSSQLVKNGLFSAYSTIESLDYPPLFLFPLYLVGLVREIPGVISEFGADMLILKFWQMLFDVLTILMIYQALKKYDKFIALILAATWALNPAIIMNSTTWGQTDSLMIFLLLVTFYFFEEDKPILSLVVFALACLCKFQSLYFAPVILLFLFKNYKIKKALIAFGSSLLTGLVVFFPFMLYSGVLLPIEVYLGGINTYNKATLNSFNFYSAIGLNFVDLSENLIFNIPISLIGTIALLASFAFLVYIFFKSKNPCPYLVSFIFMQTIFMFSTRMHERYQIPVIIFLIVACAKHKSMKLFVTYSVISLIVFINQLLIFEYFVYEYDFLLNNFNVILIVFSIINLIIYFITIHVAMKVMEASTPKDKIDEETKEDSLKNPKFEKMEI